MGDQPLNQRLREIREAEDAQAVVAMPEQPPESQPRAQLGRLLVGKGLLSEAVLEHALEQQGENGRPLGQILIELGAISPQSLTRALTEQTGFDYSGSLRARLETDDTDEPGRQPAAESFLVREASDGEPLHVAASFLDAADVAFELIEERDPECLEIVRAHGGELEHVWAYRRVEEPAWPR